MLISVDATLERIPAKYIFALFKSGKPNSLQMASSSKRSAYGIYSSNSSRLNLFATAPKNQENV